MTMNGYMKILDSTAGFLRNLTILKHVQKNGGLYSVEDLLPCACCCSKIIISLSRPDNILNRLTSFNCHSCEASST